MRASIINRDIIDLIVTAITMGRIPPERELPMRDAVLSVRHADDMGRTLWAANHAAANEGRDGELMLEPPAYEWRPVLELIGARISSEQLIQIERTRRYLVEQSRQAPDWEDHLANRLLIALGQAIAIALNSWPTDGDDGRAYEGLDDAVAEWSRDAGFAQISRAGHESEA